MHIHAKLIGLMSAFLTMNEVSATPPASLPMFKQQASAVCTDYQRCSISGVVNTVRPAGGHSSVVLTLADGHCLPLLLSDTQSRFVTKRASQILGVTGVTLPRLVEDSSGETLALGYFDRWLPTESCPTAQRVIYVERLTLIRPPS